MDTNNHNLNLQGMFAKPILKTGKPTVLGGKDSKIRTLRADEYEALRVGAGKESNQVQLDTLLLTGMRYVEVQRLHERPEWFDGNFVYLPREAVLKQERKQAERYVRLNLLGKEILPRFFEVKNIPSSETWRENLERWAGKVGLDPVGLGPKTTRKTWESWLMTVYPEHSAEIVLSQGHTAATSLHHYLNMPFLQTDKERIKVWVGGFF